MQHLIIACYYSPSFLLVCVVPRVAIAELLGFGDCFAIDCSKCGGDPERSLKQGPTSKFTAAGCTTLDVVDVDVGILSSAWWSWQSVAELSPKWRLSVWS